MVYLHRALAQPTIRCVGQHRSYSTGGTVLSINKGVDMSTVKSVIGSVAAVADTATAVVNVVNQYATGWSSRSALAERTRMVQAEYEHKVEMASIPEEAALALAKRIQQVADKAKDLQHFEAAKAVLANMSIEETK